MSYKTLTVQRQGNVLVISIIGPGDAEKMVQQSNELTDLCEEITWDENIKAIILTGTGETSFYIEPDLIKIISSDHNDIWTRYGFIAKTISKLNRPVIAAIDGDATGLGLELALASDIRIAAEKARFGLPQIKSGMIPWNGGTQRLTRLIGKGKAFEMILTGDLIDAREAYRIGLVNKVVPSHDLMVATMDMTKEMGARGPIALRYAKEAIYKGMDMTLEQGLRLEADLYLLIHTTNDRSEGIKAFQEKKSPHFKGE